MQKGTDCLPSWSQDYLYSICSHRLSREKRKCFTVNSFNRNISRTRGEKSVTTQFPRLHSLWESKWKPQWSELFNVAVKSNSADSYPRILNIKAENSLQCKRPGHRPVQRQRTREIMERRPQTRTKAKTTNSQLIMASHVSNQQRGNSSEHLNCTPVTPLEGPLILHFARVVLQPFSARQLQIIHQICR